MPRHLRSITQVSDPAPANVVDAGLVLLQFISVLQQLQFGFGLDFSQLFSKITGTTNN